jgi:purine-binding chemotaxis protein CheW
MESSDFYDAKEYADGDDNAQKDKYITFRLGNEEYAIEICYVREIIGMQKIAGLPDMSDYILGVINLRSNIITVIDVRRRFNMQVVNYNDRTCIIVISIKDRTIGLVVDEVSEVLDILPNQIESPPKTTKRTQSRFIKGIGKSGDQVKIILNTDAILDEEEMAAIANSD